MIIVLQTFPPYHHTGLHAFMLPLTSSYPRVQQWHAITQRSSPVSRTTLRSHLLYPQGPPPCPACPAPQRLLHPHLLPQPRRRSSERPGSWLPPSAPQTHLAGCRRTPGPVPRLSAIARRWKPSLLLSRHLRRRLARFCCPFIKSSPLAGPPAPPPPPAASPLPLALFPPQPPWWHCSRGHCRYCWCCCLRPRFPLCGLR